MAAVKFSLRTRPSKAIARFEGSSATVVIVPPYSLDASIEPDCQSGSATVGQVRLPDASTPFEKIKDHTYRLLNRSIPVNPHDGDTRIGSIRLSIKTIAVETQVNVQRNLNSLLTGARKGGRGRPLATPQYRVRARSCITFAYDAIEEQQTFKGGINRWQSSGTTAGKGGTMREEGPWGDVLFLHDSACGPFEPPAGVLYNQFVTIVVETLAKKVT